MSFRFIPIISGLILLLSSSISVFGQPCNIIVKGKVVDQHDNHMLEYATIYIQENQQGLITDENGNFVFNNICNGKYHFIISHLGCESKNLFIDINQDTTLNIIMEHHDEFLDEVLISGRDLHTKTGLNKSVVSKEMILELSGRNLAEMLASIPGVNMLRSGPNLSKPIINGLYGNRVTILNNGIPQEGQQWGNDHAPEIDPNTGDKISVYKGANAIKYGLSALGGLVIIEPNELSFDPHWHGDFKLLSQTNGRVAGIQSSLLKSMSWGNTRWTGGFTLSGDRHAPDYFLTNTGSNEKSFSVLISNKDVTKSKRKVFYSFYNTDIGILRGSHIGNLTDLNEALTRDVPFFTKDKFSYQINSPRQSVIHHLIKYSQSYIFSEKYSVVFESAIQANLRKEYDVRRGDRSKIPSLNLSLFSQYYDLQLNYQPASQEIYHSIGVQYRTNNNTNNPGTGIRPLIPDYLNHTLALYYIHKNKVGSFPMELGLRSEYRNYGVYSNTTLGGKTKHHFLNIAVNMGVKKEITKLLNTTLDIAYTGRPPEVNELYSNGLHQGVSGIEEGNKDLKAEQSFKIVNEWNGHISHHHHINISFFYNKFWNFIYLQPSDELRLTIRGAFPVFRYVGADVNMAGLSFKSNVEINQHLQWSNALHYTYAQNLTLGQGLIRIPPLSVLSNINYTIGKSKFFNEIKAGTEISYTAKQNRVNPTEDFVLPPDDYMLINLLLKIKWKTPTQNDLDLIIRCENLFNTNYRDYLNRLRYFANETGRNVYFTLNLSF